MRGLLILMLTALLSSAAAAEQNPHDGYVFWLPCGELRIGDPSSEKEFNYARTKDGERFMIRPRRTRFDVPAGQIVIIKSGSAREGPKYTVDGRYVPDLLVSVTFLPREMTQGKNEVRVDVDRPAKRGDRYLFYYTDDADKLGRPVNVRYLVFGEHEPRPEHLVRYGTGLIAFWNGEYRAAKADFLAAAERADTPEAARLLLRLTRWADAELRFRKIRSGPGFYKLGLYSMTNGFWDLAADCFKKATELMPKNPDAWYMLGDAMSYKISDLDKRMEMIYPYYRKAADLYPKDGSNTFRTFFGLFRKLRVKDGDKETVLNMTDEQIEDVKKAWEWCSAIMEGASRGALRMLNTYKVYDQEFDSADPWTAKPFEGLFKRGEIETFIKMTGWGASDCCGMDCGPDRSAFINLGIREWDVMLHEWNHSLDWAMIVSELGTGVPATHSSDWCGFEPISSMGMGHHSCNRYYMTPGMYRFVRGTDPVTTPYITDWLATDPRELVPEVTDAQIKDEKLMGTWTADVRKKTTEVPLPKRREFRTKPKVDNGYIDLMASYAAAPRNAFAFAKTYIYSPKQQKVRMWIGADDNIRMWLNGRPIHKGVYWACALFTECREKDMTAKGVMLQKGWNELVVQVTNAQHGSDWLGGSPADTWGFSVRVCDNQNREVPGLRYRSVVEGLDYADEIYAPPSVDPKSPKTYSWNAVKDDYTVLLPELTIDDLRAITGYKTLKASDDIFFDLSGEKFGPAFRPYVIDKSDPENIGLNNELNWYLSPKEMAAFIRYKRGGQVRDLLFLRPEVYETYFALMPVKPEARKLGIKRHADQVIGCFLTQREDSPNGRIVLVVDTHLGDKLPVDEEDLLDISALR